MRRIWGGFWKEASQILMSFFLFESCPKPLTLRETIVKGRSDMVYARLGGRKVDRSHEVMPSGPLFPLVGTPPRWRGLEEAR